MKDFCKWLGVNEKIAKIVVWLFIFMAMLIIFNTALESLGFPYYKITIENLDRLNYSKVLEYLSNWIMIFLNFYSMIFLIFRTSQFKMVFKYSLIYFIVNILIFNLFGDVALQVFIIVFILILSYFLSKKNIKYILYGIGSIAINFVVQYICYTYKIKFIDYSTTSFLNRLMISLDYFIIMFIIIVVKEIILKKRGEK